MVNTIPAADIADVVPSVLSAGGSALDLVGLMLTNGNRVPQDAVPEFPDAKSVSDYFGSTSIEAINAAVYFNGFLGSSKRPAKLHIANYNTANVGAFVRGGKVNTLTLSQLQALSGVLTVVIDGVSTTSSSINLSGATSFSSAANLMTVGIGLTGPTKAVVTASIGATFTATGSGTNLTVASVAGGVIHTGATITGTGVPGSTTIVSQTSGTTGGAGIYVTSNATTSSSATITATSTTLDVTAVSSGTISLGNQVTGSGVTSGTFITALGSGSGGVGTYVLTNAQQVVSESMTLITPTVSYDSLTGGFTVVSGTTGASSTIDYLTGTLSTATGLTAVTGAVLSQGAATAVPATFMDNITDTTQDWATLFHVFDPDAGSGNTQKKLFCDWINASGNRYAYFPDDTDITPTLSTTATTSLGWYVISTNMSGISPIYDPLGMHLPAFMSGAVASINYEEHEGRTTLAFRRQAGLGISVTNRTVSRNLIANGYNFTGNYATANDTFQIMYPGSISGDFQWIDSYVNAIQLNNALQQSAMNLLVQNKSVPYNPPGRAAIRAGLLDPILAAFDFGSIRAGVVLSEAQKNNVNSAAGMRIDDVLFSRGWYLQVNDASPQVRQARGTPEIHFWYMDGQSVQKLVISSILIQ